MDKNEYQNKKQKKKTLDENRIDFFLALMHIRKRPLLLPNFSGLVSSEKTTKAGKKLLSRINIKKIHILFL